MDCRETDEVSVLLLSKAEAATGFGAVAVFGDGLELDGLDIPVMRSLLKLSTSRFAFGVPVPGFSADARSDHNMSVIALL